MVGQGDVDLVMWLAEMGAPLFMYDETGYEGPQTLLLEVVKQRRKKVGGQSRRSSHGCSLLIRPPLIANICTVSACVA